MSRVRAVERSSRLGVRACALPLALGLIASPAPADELGFHSPEPFIEVHGFASQGFFLTLGNDFLAPGSQHGSFEFSEIGLNFTKSLGDNLSFGAQLFAQDLGRRGNYTPTFDWFYVDYRFTDWFGLRAGRLKIPYGLYNEIQDIDAARVPVLLPGSVYPLQGRLLLWAHTGAEVYGFARSRALGAVEYRLFAGSIFIDTDTLRPPGSTIETVIDVPYVVGTRLLWETPLDGLRLSGSIETIRLETTAFVPMFGEIAITNRSVLWVASAEYTASELTLTAEYSRWHVRQWSDRPELSPSLNGEGERLYGMATYRASSWFYPGAYYAFHYPHTKLRKGRENYQHDVALTFRFDLDAHWLVKLEGHYMNGTAGLLDPLRLGDADVSKAERHWAAFFLKTTAHF